MATVESIIVRPILLLAVEGETDLLTVKNFGLPMKVLPHLWDECDIMLIGPSRAGKTPLSFYLAQRGYKAGKGRRSSSV